MLAPNELMSLNIVILYTFITKVTIKYLQTTNFCGKAGFLLLFQNVNTIKRGTRLLYPMEYFLGYIDDDNNYLYSLKASASRLIPSSAVSGSTFAKEMRKASGPFFASSIV